MSTIKDVWRKQSNKEKIVCLTAYDSSFASLADQAGVDIVLVGDSLGMVVQGFEDTLRVKMRHMVYHTECVSRSVKRAFVMSDMPFLSYRTPDIALKNAGRLMRAGAKMVKLEGGENIAHIVKYLSENFIPVCAHIGLKPQQVRQLGGYHRQGEDDSSKKTIFQDAKKLVDAGAQILLLECVHEKTAQKVRDEVGVLTIGIGSGKFCDGQILVIYDVIGISNRIPPFSRNFMLSSAGISDAILQYVKGVKSGEFP